mmetsp:Transcript_52936/g.147415  ORF Transcript_52936/g.147415 Transcript_52936/m.147415 type:complete len:343 (+) Transcript_52936:714-1742(+)
MRSGFIQPENGLGSCGPSARYGKFHPVLDRDILGLAHAPNVTFLDLVLEKHLPRLDIDNTDFPSLFHLESLVVGTILLRLLRHKTNVWHSAHGRDVKSPVLLAIVDGFLEDASITTVGDNCLRVAQVRVPCSLFRVWTPHLSGRADHRRHRRVDDDVARHVQVGNAVVGVHHGQLRALRVHGLDVGLDGCDLVGRQTLDLAVDVPEAVIWVDAETLKCRGVPVENILEEYTDHVAEHDRIGHLHHRCLQMEGAEHTLLHTVFDLALEESPKMLLAHERRVDHLAWQERGLWLQDGRWRAVGGYELDADLAGALNSERFFARVEVPLAHMRDVCLRVRRPLPH